MDKNELQKSLKTENCRQNWTEFRNFQGKEKLEERKQIEFSEKIDELNQETDTLMDEIDKWQT